MIPSARSQPDEMDDYELGYDQEAQDAFDRASKLQARACSRP